MVFSIPILVVVGFTGLVFMLAGLWMRNNPPKRINHIYGYRTPRSMESQENWDLAQVYSSKQMLVSGILLFLLSLPVAVFPIPELAGIIIGIALIVVACVVIIIRTEKAMKAQKSG